MRAVTALRTVAPIVGLACAVALAAGGCKRRERPLPPQAAAPAPGAMPAPAPGGMPAPGAPAGGPVDYTRRIAAAEQVVAKDPKNLQAWVELGNDYFDTQQRQKAVDAYARALELDPSNPNVLTDQGIMYRELGQYDRAVANFQKANQLDPSHQQSLYNLGIVYAYDLGDRDKAVQAWTRIVEQNPNSPGAVQARQAIEQLRSAPPAPSSPRPR